ncbi:hypothetical protein [Streptomyces sp. NPDC001594]
MQELVAEGDRVVARVTQSGTHPRQISQIRAVSDRLGLFLQLGWAGPNAH